MSRFSTNKSLYLANDTSYRHSYYGTRIGTRMRSIKWCHFQWPWTNPNPVFKVTPLFDAKYLTNGYRYDHCVTLLCYAPDVEQIKMMMMIVTIEGEYETALKLLNATGFSDLEWPLSQISRSRYYSTSKKPKMV